MYSNLANDLAQNKLLTGSSLIACQTQAIDSELRIKYSLKNLAKLCSVPLSELLGSKRYSTHLTLPLPAVLLQGNASHFLSRGRSNTRIAASSAQVVPGVSHQVMEGHQLRLRLQYG